MSVRDTKRRDTRFSYVAVVRGASAAADIIAERENPVAVA
jgi:hypothetical protein